MNLLIILSLFFINKLQEKFKLPKWHNNIKCKTDTDCPVPFACCHDAFFPMKDKYCCSNYKKREYEYDYKYVYNYEYVK